MYNIEKYKNDIKKLAFSTVYKLDIIAQVTNEYIKKYFKGITVSEDRTTWKYYKNLSGQYHELDLLLYPNGLEIELIETGVMTTITVDVLRDNKYTREALINKTDLFTNLIHKYPKSNMIIKGMLYPVEINKLIDMEDGTIISFNKNLVEDNEISLMFKLELSIKNMLERWLSKDYALLEELYISTLMSNIANMLTLKIHNLRLANVGTGEVTSFHMDEFFSSNMSINKYVSNIPIKEKFWLYKHMRHLITNVGHAESMKLLVDNLFTPNNIDVDGYSININNPVLLEDYSDLSKASYIVPRDNIYIDNDKFETVDSRTSTIQCLETLPAHQASVEFKNDTLFRTIDEVTERPVHSEKTKMLKLSYSIRDYNNLVDKTEMAIENWIDLTYTYGINLEGSYRDSRTSVILNMRSKGAILIVLKMILVMNGSEDKLLTKINLNSILKNIGQDIEISIPDDIINVDLINTIPLSSMVNNTREDITLFIDKIINWMFRFTSYSMGTGNPVRWAFLEMVRERMQPITTILLSDTPKTIDELLLEQGIIHPLESNTDYNEDIKDIVLTFTGVTIDESIPIKDKLNNYKNILDRLTSYTTLTVLGDIEDVIPVSMIGIGHNTGLNAFGIKDGTSKCLEYTYDTTISGITNDDSDVLLVLQGNKTFIEFDDDIPTPSMEANISDDILYEGNRTQITM